MKKAFITLCASLLLFGNTSGAYATTIYNGNLLADIEASATEFYDDEWIGAFKFESPVAANYNSYGIPYLKFDLTPMQSIDVNSITSVQLKMFGINFNYDGWNESTSHDLYLVENNNWDENIGLVGIHFDPNYPIITGLMGNDGWMSWDISIADYKNEIAQALSNGMVSFGIDSNPAVSEWAHVNGFSGREFNNDYAARLIVQTATPVPEPASMLLGLLGLGGALGLRRKK